MRLMYDSTAPWAIPDDAEMVAYYVDGRYAWPQSWLDLFPNAVKVSISAVGTRSAQVGDVEPGCIWPPENAVPWVLQARADGFDPTIYVNERNDWGPTITAFNAAEVSEPHWWVAHYDGVREVPAGAVAKQFAHPGDGGGQSWETGAHYDLSIVADYWPGVDIGSPGGGGGGANDMPSAQEVSDAVWNRPVDVVDGSTPDGSLITHRANAVDVLRYSELQHIISRGKLDALLARPDVLQATVTMTDRDRAEIAAKIRLGLLEDLAPLFELAERLKD